MTMLQIPIECIALTIEYIGECGDNDTLLSLLLVSRAVSHEAATVLYRNPFRFLMAENPRAQRRPENKDLDRRGWQAMALVRLLARCLPDHLQSPFLKKILALEQPWSPSISPTLAAADGVIENTTAAATSHCGEDGDGSSNIQEDDSLLRQYEQQGATRLSGARSEHPSVTAPSVDDKDDKGRTRVSEAGTARWTNYQDSLDYGHPSKNYLAFLTHYDWVLFSFQVQFAIDFYCPWRPLFELDEDPAQRAATEADVNNIHPGSENFLEVIDNAMDHQDGFYQMMCATAKLFTLLRLEREMTWAVCQERLDALRSLKIPLRDIDRFQGLLVQRGGHLQSLSFAVPWDRPLLARQPEVWEKVEPLIRQHTCRHPGTLKEVHVQSLWANDLTNHQELNQYYTQWYQLLPPCSPPPININSRTIKRLLPRWNETDYSKVTSIHLLPGRMTEIESTFLESIFPRCRSLEVLLAKLSANAFQWAVNESSGGALAGRQSSSSRPAERHSNHSSNDYSNQLVIPKPISPVPLKLIQCTVSINDVQKILRDATWAFHSTLATVVVQAMRETPSSAPPPQHHPPSFHTDAMPYSPLDTSSGEAWEDFLIGHDWRHDRLCKLHVTATVPLGRLKLDRGFFEGCTSMQDLRLHDASLEYDATKIMPCRIHPKNVGAMRELRALDLCGTPALMFNPRVLRDAPHLERLNLGWPHDSGMYFVTPVQDDELGNDYELDPEALAGQVEDDHDSDDDEGLMGSLFSKRRGWTWDWHLPSLTYLHLSGDWALRCRLRLLAGCPLLEELQMSMDNRLRISRHVTVEGIHEAMALGRLRQGLNHKKLGGAGDEVHHVGDDNPPLILLPKLRKLDIFGPWHFGPGAFELFFSVLSPNIHTMKIPSSKGFTAEQLLEVTSKMPNLQMVNFPWLFQDEDEPYAYGLELIESYEWNTYRNIPVPVPLYKSSDEADVGTMDSSNAPSRPQPVYNTMGLFYRLLSPEERSKLTDTLESPW